MPITCIIPGCKSRAGKESSGFYNIPTALSHRHALHLNELSERRRILWLIAINRPDLTAEQLKNQRVCSQHFIKGKPSALLEKDDPDWVPSLNLNFSGFPRKSKQVKKKGQIPDWDSICKPIPTITRFTKVERISKDKRIDNTYGVEENSKEVKLLVEEENYDADDDCYDSDLSDYDESNWKVCRICVLEQQNLVSVNQTFENCGHKSTLKQIFNDCSPVQINSDDGYPQKFCIGCLSELLKTYEFRQKCLKSQTLLEQTCKTEVRVAKKRTISESDSASTETVSNKMFKKENCAIDFENIIVKNEIIFQDQTTDNSDYDNSMDEIEEFVEEPMPSTSRESPKLKVLKAVDDGDSSKNADPDKYTSKIILTSTRGSNNVGEFKKVKIQGGSKLVYVPPAKEKAIALPEKNEHPDLGQFKITVMRGYKNSSHVVYEANGFLYVNTRNTPHRRYLRCSTSRNCPGKACIDVKPHDEMEEFLYVYKLHNHPKDTLHITKLKFLEEMRNVANDGIHTPKQVYEIAINKYPELRNVMSYSTLSSRLYRLSTGSTTQSQLKLNTLYKFGMHMMTSTSTKYSQTHCGHKFFQEAVFDEESDACSVIFANTSLIDNMSWSNELFVDSSFMINFENDQRYHFLTICVSVNEHRFPVYFVLMNTATFEEYVKVLTLFKDKYAPSLHPEEIVTDFDATLFRALSEVYNHSTISGSLVHYIFNVYKQCSVEDIIKQIEVKAECMKMQTYLFSLPILPPQMIPAALEHLRAEAVEIGIEDIFENIFRYVNEVWINYVTPQVFTSFCNMNSVNENIFNTYKKIRDIIASNKKYGFFEICEKLIAIDEWVTTTYQKVLYGEKLPRQFASSKYSKVLDRLWQPNHIDKCGFTSFFEIVSPLIEKMTGLIWIWGFYNYSGGNDDVLITPQEYFGTDVAEHVMDTEVEGGERDGGSDADGEGDGEIEHEIEHEIEAEVEEDGEVDEGDGSQIITLQLVKTTEEVIEEEKD